MTQRDCNQNLTAGIEGSIATTSTSTCTSTSTGRPRFTKEKIGTIPFRLVKYIRRKKHAQLSKTGRRDRRKHRHNVHEHVHVNVHEHGSRNKKLAQVSPGSLSISGGRKRCSAIKNWTSISAPFSF